MISFFTALISFLIDIKTKDYIKKNYKQGQSKDILQGNIKIKHTKNKGLMLGKFKNKPEIVKGMNIFGGIALIIILFVTLGRKVSDFTQLGLGLLIGGGVGNLYDRFKYGEVTDFFSFKWLPKVIFNIADMFIILGSFIVFLGELFKELK